MRRVPRARSFSPCGRRCRREATTDEGSPLTRPCFAGPPPPSRGQAPLPQGEREGGGARTRRPSPARGLVHRWFKELSDTQRGERDAGSPALFKRYVRLGAQVPPDIPRRSFRLLSGHPYGWADGSARSPGYRNRDRGTRPRLRQRCPVSTAVPPPETSERFIGIKAGIVKCHVMAVLGLDPRIGPAIHEGRSQRTPFDVTAPGGRGWPGRAHGCPV